MDKQTRLALIKERAGKRLALSPAAAQILEDVRKEDADLGGVVAIGEILAPDEIAIDKAEETEDEENHGEDETAELSPAMRALAHEEEKAARKLSRKE